MAKKRTRSGKRPNSRITHKTQNDPIKTKATREKLKKILVEATKTFQKTVEEKFITEFHVPIPLAYVSGANGQLALYPSMARHDDRRAEMWNRLYRADYDGRLDSVLKRMSRETGYTTRELYTLYVSP